MSWDSDRVRIELCQVMAVGMKDGAATMTAQQGADIWLGDGDGRISRARKPHITLVDDTRAGVLRQIADWIEHNDDPGLTRMAVEITGAREAAKR